MAMRMPLDTIPFSFEESFDRCDDMVHLPDADILMAADVGAVVGAVFGFRKIALFVAHEFITGGLSGDGIKQVARINALFFQIRDKLVFGEIKAWL